MAFIDPDQQQSFVDPDDDASNKQTKELEAAKKMKAPSWARVALGAPEAAVSMLAGVPSQIAGGLYGLGTLLSGQGLDKAANASKRVQEENFGLGSFRGISDAGKESTQVLGEALYKPVEWAGKGAEAIGLDPIYGALPAEVALNFMPLGGVALGVKGTKKALEPKPSEKPAATVPETKPVETPEVPATPEVLQVTPDGQAMRPEDAMWRERALELQRAEQMKQMTNESQQMELFDQPEMGRVANPYEAKLGDWRVDENGIPIKADLSMELQQLGQPLQRNLWGDELPQTRNPVGQAATLFDENGLQQGIPLTEAIDSMPWAQRRGAINSQLRGDVDADGRLQGAVAEANSPFAGPGRSQAGAIDVEGVRKALSEFAQGLRSSKDALESFRGTFYDDELNIARQESLDPKSRERLVWMTPDEFHNYALKRNSWNIQTEGRQTAVREAIHQKEGLATMPQLFVNKGMVWGHEGRHRMDIFKELGIEKVPVRLRDSHIRNKDGPLAQHYESLISQNGDVVPVPQEVLGNTQNMGGMAHSQRGAVDWNNVGESIKRIAGLTKDSPEVIKAQKQQAVNRVLGDLGGYSADIRTPEQVIAAAEKAKDIGPVQAFNAKSWRPGLRPVTISSKGNPLLKFANYVIPKAWNAAEQYARQYITDNKTGIGTPWRQLSSQEKIEVHELLKAGDRKQRRYTREELLSNNFSQKQVDFIEKLYAMDDKKYEVWNDFRMQVGQEPLRYREGHWAGVFKGDYKSLVLDGDKNVIGYIGADTLLGYNRALKAVKEKYPDATITDRKRTPLGGYGNRSDMFSGLNDLLQVLAKNDPRIADILQVVENAVVQRADATFGANLHAMEKKGIFGNEGNKPWKKDKLEEANDAMKAFLEYWEEGMISHHMLPVEAQLTALMRNPALDNMPRAKQYLNDYVQSVTGRHVGDLGMALNTIIDLPFKLTGLGPSIPREIVNQFTKRMGQWTQGWLNIPYTAMQFTQLAQTGMPLFTKVAQATGGDIAGSTARAFNDAMTMWAEKLFDKKPTDSPEQRAMFDYAEQRGLLQFSEFEEVSQISQNQASRMFDQVVDANRTLGEKGTRPLAFFTFVHLLEKSGLPLEQRFDMAYNLTQDAMVDYSARERAPMFKSLGVLGQTAGNLQQFGLTYLDQIGRWHKDALKGNPAPLIAGMAGLMAFAGLQGLPFYTTADEIVQWITNKYFGEKKSINTMVMQNAPEWIKSDWFQYGLASDATDMNISSRLGMADVLPESLLDAVSPYASSVGRMGGAVAEAFKNPDELSFSQLAREFAPSSMRGLIENNLLTSPTGLTINKEGQGDYPRTEADMFARKLAMTSLEESKNKEKLYTNRKSLEADAEKVAALTKKISRRYQYSPEYFESDNWQKDLQEYTNRGGDPNQLVNTIIKDIEAKQLTSKQRLEGTQLKSVAQLRRWLKINQE